MPRRGATKNPSAPELAQARARDASAVQLALAGASYDQIAEQLGYSNRSGAWKAVQRALDRTEIADVTSLRDQELARLDRLHMAAWPAALRGDLQSIAAVLRISERRSRLLGLDHADGVAERQVTLDEQRQALLVAVAVRAFGDLLPPEQLHARISRAAAEIEGTVT